MLPEEEAFAQLLAEEKEIQAKIDEVAAEERKLANIRAEFYRQAEKLREKKWDMRNAVRAAEEQRRQEQMKLDLEAKAKEQQDKVARLSQELDDLTANAKWRNRALEHQVSGAKYLASARRAICADGMGVGKTLQSLIFLDMVQSNRALIVCPGDTMQNFANELSRFTDRPVAVIGKKPKLAASHLLEFFSELEKVVVIINYESWYKNRAILTQLINFRFDTVIVDEAHNIKETDKAPYQGVESIVLAENSCPKDHGALILGKDKYYHCSTCDWSSSDYTSFTRHDRRSVVNFLPMSGTPILNRPDEIYPLLHLVDDQQFPHKTYFKRDFCTVNADNKLVWNYGGESRLAKMIAGYYLRRTHKDAGIVLPPQGVTVHEIEFDPEMYPLQAKIMKMLREHAQVEIDAGRAITIPALLALITRERQAATWPGGIRLSEQATVTKVHPLTGEEYTELVWDYENPYSDGSPRPVLNWYTVGDQYRESQKLDRAVDLIKQLNDDGRRVVVFSQFKTALEELSDRLGSNSVRFDGDTDNASREAIKRNFNREFGEEPKWDNILCNYKTGGVGLNLTAATAVVILDQEWNEGKEEQAFARVNRIGQTEETQVHILRLMGTIDEWMHKLIMSKSQVTGNFANAMSETDQFKVDFAKELKAILEG